VPNRIIRTIINPHVICRDTEKEARAQYQSILDHQDPVAADNFHATFASGDQSSWKQPTRDQWVVGATSIWLGPRTNRRLVHSAQEGGLRRGSSQLFRLYPGSGIFRSKSHSTHASGRLAGRNGRASTMTLSRPNFAPADPECLLRSICETYSEHLSSEIAPIAEIGRTLTVARRPMPSRQRAFTHSGRSRPAVEPSAASVGSAHRRMCMAKWSADASCREAAEDPILVTRPTSEAGRTPEGGEHARRLSYGMRLS
jgi:hypothetical protein